MSADAQRAVGVPSDRVRLAALARDTALAVPGVVELDSAPTGLFATVGAGVPVAGVRCLAAPEGGFDLSLRLVCELVALHPLADRVRAAIEAAAAREKLTVQSVTITIADVTEDARAR